MIKTYKLYVLVVLCTVFTSLTAYAADTWIESGKIIRIQPHPTRGTVYITHTHASTQSTCSRYDMIRLNSSNLLFKETLSVILTSFAANKDIRLKIVACDPDSGRPIIDSVMLCHNDTCT